MSLNLVVFSDLTLCRQCPAGRSAIEWPSAFWKELQMSTSMLLERSTPAVAPTGQAGYSPAGSMGTANWCVVPRCQISFEKCKGGLRISCVCDDEVSCGTLQNLCKMLCDGTCSCVCNCNGIQVCQVNLTMGICKCEFTKDGVCITCVSGDKKCCDMLQACCDAMACCCETGCCCYVSFNNTPVCCGTC